MYEFLEKREDGSYCLIKGFIEVYLPKYLFEKEISSILGNTVTTIGIFNFKYKENENDKNFRLFESKLAVTMQFTFSDKRLSTEILKKGMEEDEYYIFILKEGDYLNKTNNHIQDILDVNKYISLVNGGKLPQTMRYTERYDSVLINTAIMNKISLGVPSVVIEFTNAELCRIKDDVNKPFRKLIGRDDYNDEYSYSQLSIKDLAMRNSTFSAITFENINKALVNGINNTLEGVEEKETPIEKIVKY